MTKEEIQKNSEHWYNKYKDAEKRITDLEKENAELRNNGFTVSAMTEQQLKVAIEKGEQLEKENADLRDNYDQFKAVAVPEIERLQKENAELKHNKKTVVRLADCLEEKMKERIEELEQQIEQMKSDVTKNIKWADQNKNNQMYCKLNSMINQWEIKENDKRRT